MSTRKSARWRSILSIRRNQSECHIKDWDKLAEFADKDFKGFGRKKPKNSNGLKNGIKSWMIATLLFLNGFRGVRSVLF